MILIFLGSWRSTLIIAISIPLSILTSIIVLSALGETINIMTLGGLALAVGILVDDATVEIENINRNIARGQGDRTGDSGRRAADRGPGLRFDAGHLHRVRADVLPDRRRAYLFVPLAEAVVFAMLASYLLSRTLVPTMAKYLLRGHEQEAGHLNTASRNPLVRMQVAFELGFEKFRDRYHALLERCLHHRAMFLSGFVIACARLFVSCSCPGWGRISFPQVDGGQFKLHVRARAGTRIEETRESVRPDRRLHPANRFRRAKSPASSTTSVCPTAASTSRTATPRPSGPPTRTFWLL